MAEAEALSVEVFTGPETAFFVTSTLVFGHRQAVLVDAQLTRGAGRELAEWVAGKGRELTAVLVTHGHPDHYFGVEEVLRLFPTAPLYAAPEVVETITATAMAKVAQWRPIHGDDVTDRPLVPQPLPEPVLRVDGEELRVLSLGQADGPPGTVVHVPAARTVVAGDFAYYGTHVWTAETNAAMRRDWLANLERLRELGPERVIAGHRAPGRGDDAKRVLDFTATYLRDFDDRLAEHPDDADALVAAVNATYGQLTVPIMLQLGARANVRRRGR
jgi:glyoxylase-like metal-dependent hydrolase (beta-lactamase superfamily II)